MFELKRLNIQQRHFRLYGIPHGMFEITWNNLSDCSVVRNVYSLLRLQIQVNSLLWQGWSSGRTIFSLFSVILFFIFYPSDWKRTATLVFPLWKEIQTFSFFIEECHGVFVVFKQLNKFDCFIFHISRQQYCIDIWQ